jgi:hypothetical protein
LQSTWGGTGLSPAFFAACANSQQVVVIALSACAQLIDPSGFVNGAQIGELLLDSSAQSIAISPE